METQTQTSKGSVIGVGILLLIIIAIFGSCFSNNDHTDKVSIVNAVQDDIKKGLFNPSGASFSSIDDTTMTKEDDGTYTVDGYIDGTNGFGAKMRNNYEAHVTVKDNGYLIDYKLQNAVTGEWQ